MDIPKPEGWQSEIEILDRVLAFDQSFSNDTGGGGFAWWHDEGDEVELLYHYLEIAPDILGERVEIWDYRPGVMIGGESGPFHWVYQRARVGWQVIPSGLVPAVLAAAPAWDVGPEKFPIVPPSASGTSDERAVAKLIADMLEASEISGIEQIALAGDDDDLKLPAIVVAAKFEEEARALKKNGRYGSRFRVDIELRGIRTKPGTDALDTIQAEIDTAMNSAPAPLPDSAAAFSYFLVDERLENENTTDEETRKLNRSYSVFALLA